MSLEAGFLTATEALDYLQRGTLSAMEYAQTCIKRLEQVEGDVHAFAHFNPEHVLEQARAADAHKAAGRHLGRLHGLPVAIKDIIDTFDFPTEYGSALCAERRPSRDAFVVDRIRSQGGIIFGKTVTSEFAFTTPGPTRNPHDLQRTPGGSSSGSAAAVAAGIVPLAVGSQTGGSTIRPASFCGVIGVKPTHGLISRGGMLLLSRKLDHVGVFSRSVADAALLLDVIAGYDQDDEDTRASLEVDFSGACREPLTRTPRIAYVRTPMWERADEDARHRLDAFAKELGSCIQEVDTPDYVEGAWNAQKIILSADMASNLGTTINRKPELASDAIRTQMAMGQKIAANEYKAALKLADRVQEWFRSVLTHYDFMITPAAPGVAPQDLSTVGDPVFNSLWSLTGLPALTLPLLSGREGLPLGVQLVAAPKADACLLQAAVWLAHRSENKGRPLTA